MSISQLYHCIVFYMLISTTALQHLALQYRWNPSADIIRFLISNCRVKVRSCTLPSHLHFVDLHADQILFYIQLISILNLVHSTLP